MRLWTFDHVRAESSHAGTGLGLETAEGSLRVGTGPRLPIVRLSDLLDGRGSQSPTTYLPTQCVFQRILVIVFFACA